MWHNVSSLLPSSTSYPHVCINYLLEYPQLHIFFTISSLLLYIQLLLHVNRFRLKSIFFPDLLSIHTDGILCSFNTSQLHSQSNTISCPTVINVKTTHNKHFFISSLSPIEDSIFINWCKKFRDRKKCFRMSGEFWNIA